MQPNQCFLNNPVHTSKKDTNMASSIDFEAEIISSFFKLKSCKL